MESLLVVFFLNNIRQTGARFLLREYWKSMFGAVWQTGAEGTTGVQTVLTSV